MSVRKRIWRTIRGANREAWVVAYTDVDGKRRLRTFDTKAEAQLYWTERVADLPPRSSIYRVLSWLKDLEREMRNTPGSGDTGKVARKAIDALEELT